jgi:hypothetical protein
MAENGPMAELAKFIGPSIDESRPQAQLHARLSVSLALPFSLAEQYAHRRP